MKKINKKANILTENIIFIILNLIFIMILVLFVFSKSENAAFLEEKYAKQIAMIIDSAKPVMTIKLNVEDAIKEKDKNFDMNNMVVITDNLVTIKLRDKEGYSYSFFNNVEVKKYFDEQTSEYIFIIANYKNKVVGDGGNINE
jgi:uncharacterized protein YpmS